MFPVTNRKIFYILSTLLIAGSIAAPFIFGIKWGIDFTGGSLMEVSYEGQTPEKSSVEEALGALSLELGRYSLRESGDTGYVLRTRDLTEEEHQTIKSALALPNAGTMQEVRYTSIGPSVGAELRTKALWAFMVVIFAITLYIAFVFRKVSKPVSSWIYGATVVISLIHDIVIPAGIFVVLGAFAGVEIDTLFMTSVLVILGYSISDSVVIFDRVRERLRRNEDARIKEEFETTVATAVSDTYGRSINTSVTTIIALFAVYLFGGEPTEYFSLALIIGVAVATYSSIFIAAPLLVTIQKWQSARKK